MGARLSATASSLALLLGFAAAPAAAQSVIYSGATDSVTVNTSVLDQLGPGAGSGADAPGVRVYGTAQGSGNFPPDQMPRSFSNVGNLTPPQQRVPAQPAQPMQTAAPQQPQAPSSSTAGLTPTQRLQQPQPSTQPAPTGTRTASTTAASSTTARSTAASSQSGSSAPTPSVTGVNDSATPSGPEDMSADPAATQEEDSRQAPTPTVTGGTSGSAMAESTVEETQQDSGMASTTVPEGTVAGETKVADAVENPPPPDSAVPESEPEPEPQAAAESATDSASREIEPSSEASAESTSASMTGASSAAASDTPEPPPAPEPPEAPASAAPAGEATQSETATADASASTAGEPEPAEAASAEETETASTETASTEPEAAAEEAPEEGSGNAQTAARTTGPGPMQGGVLRVVFESAESELPEDVKPQLKELAQSLLQEEDTRIQLLAYADGDSAESSRARRLSLARALKVRGYLIDQGIRSTRMDVRALGSNVPDGPPDRVDIQAAPR